MAKKRYKRAEKVFTISLGAGDRAFEPHYSDQTPSEVVDFRGGFLFFVYCGAESEYYYRCLLVFPHRSSSVEETLTAPVLR